MCSCRFFFFNRRLSDKRYHSGKNDRYKKYSENTSCIPHWSPLKNQFFCCGESSNPFYYQDNTKYRKDERARHDTPKDHSQWNSFSYSSESEESCHSKKWANTIKIKRKSIIKGHCCKYGSKYYDEYCVSSKLCNCLIRTGSIRAVRVSSQRGSIRVFLNFFSDTSQGIVYYSFFRSVNEEISLIPCSAFEKRKFF